MDQDKESLEKENRDLEYIRKLKANEISLPNEFTVAMGKLIKAAREDSGYSQTSLAKKLSRRQAMISEIESGKIDLDIQTLVLLSLELKKPISYFIPNMTFFTSIYDLENKFEEEVLHLVRQLEYDGDTKLIIPFLKMLSNYYNGTFDIDSE